MSPELITGIAGAVLGAINLAVILTLFLHLSGRIDALRESVDTRIEMLIEKIHELDLKIK